VKPTDAERDLAFERLIARGLEGETDVTGNACPDADFLAAWFDRSLSAPEAERVEAHASACASCQQILADLARSEPEVVRAAPLPAPSKPWHWHWRWLVPAATAALVIAVGNRTLRAPAPVGTPAWAQLKDQAPAQQPAGQQARADNPTGGQAGVPPAEKEAQPAPSSATGTGAAAPGAAAAALPPAFAPPAPLPTAAAAAARAQAAPAPAPPATRQVAPLQADAGAERKGFAAENRLAVAPPGAAGAGGSRAKPATADKADIVVGGIAESVAVTVPAAPPPPPAPMRTVVTKAESVVPLIPGVAVSPAGKVAWRVGAAGSLERSTDGRQSWQPQASGTSTNLAAASAVSDTTCWAVGARGVVLRTLDGIAWQRLSPPTGSDLVFVRASSAQDAVVRASDGSEYATSDGGRTWQKISG
jgi:hypothetical protein